MDEGTAAPPSNPRKVTRGARALALALAAVLALGACGGDDDDTSSVTVPPDDGTTTTTTTGSTTTTTDPDAAIKAEVEQAYYDQWDAFIEIFANPDPNNPLLRRHFAGEQLEQILNAIAEDLQEGVVLERPADPELWNPTLQSVEVVDQQHAIVTGCVVDGLIVRNRTTGEVVDDAVVTLHTEHSFVLEGDGWKLISTTSERAGEGNQGCAD